MGGEGGAVGEARSIDPRKKNGAGLLLTLFPVVFSAALMAATIPHIWRLSALPINGGPVGGPFHLLTTGGREVTQRSWPGRYLLVYFGYTHCPAACPTALANMEGALDTLGPRAAAVQALFVTFDPARDTRSWLGRYTALFGPRIDGLTGDPRALADAARRYAITYRRVRTGPDPDDYEFDHSSVITLMRPDGTFDRSFAADEDPAQLARDLATALGPRGGPGA